MQLHMGSTSPRAHQSRWNSRQTAQSPLPQPAGTSRSHSCQSPPQHLATTQALLSTPRHPKRTSALAGWPSCGSCWPSVCSCPRVVSKTSKEMVWYLKNLTRLLYCRELKDKIYTTFTLVYLIRSHRSHSFT